MWNYTPNNSHFIIIGGIELMHASIPHIHPTYKFDPFIGHANFFQVGEGFKGKEV